MIIYIHGFAGSGRGIKATLVKKRFKALTPSLSYIPELAVDTLEQIVETLLPMKRVKLIGSSLGGFYAWYLAEKYRLDAVLINPSVKPYETLDLWKGFVRHYHDLSSFEWNDTHIQTLRTIAPKTTTNGNYMLMLQTDDELLDYRIALETFTQAQKIVQTGGGHSFEGFENYLDRIESFFETSSKG